MPKAKKSAADPLEKVLQKNLVKLLNIYQKTHDFVFFHNRNEGFRAYNKDYLEKIGVLKGVSDFTILKPGETIFFEIKRKRGKLSEHQEAFLKSIKKLGHQGFVAYGWDDIVKTIEKIIL